MVKIMENLIKMDDLGVPLFFGNINFSCFAPTALSKRASTYGPEQQHPPVPRLPILVDSHRHLFDFPICSHLRIPHRSCVLKIWPLTGATNLVAIGWLSRKTGTTTPPWKKKGVPFIFGKKKVETIQKPIQVTYSFSETVLNKQHNNTHKSNSQTYYVSPSSIARILSYLISSHIILSFLTESLKTGNIWWNQWLAWLGFNSLIHILQKGNVSSVWVQKFRYFFSALAILQTKKRNYGEKWSIELVVAGASLQKKTKNASQPPRGIRRCFVSARFFVATFISPGDNLGVSPAFAHWACGWGGSPPPAVGAAHFQGAKC